MAILWWLVYFLWLAINYVVIRWYVQRAHGKLPWTNEDRRMCIGCALLAPISWLIVFFLETDEDDKPAKW